MHNYNLDKSCVEVFSRLNKAKFLLELLIQNTQVFCGSRSQIMSQQAQNNSATQKSMSMPLDVFDLSQKKLSCDCTCIGTTSMLSIDIDVLTYLKTAMKFDDKAVQLIMNNVTNLATKYDDLLHMCGSHNVNFANHNIDKHCSSKTNQKRIRTDIKTVSPRLHHGSPHVSKTVVSSHMNINASYPIYQVNHINLKNNNQNHQSMKKKYDINTQATPLKHQFSLKGSPQQSKLNLCLSTEFVSYKLSC